MPRKKVIQTIKEKFQCIKRERKAK